MNEDLRRTAAKLRSEGRMSVRIASLVLTVLVVVALVGVIRRDAPAAWEVWRSTDIQWAWIAAAMTSGLTGHLASVFGWHRLLRDTQTTATFQQTARIFLASNLGRYLPAGKAWQMGIVGVMALEHQLPAAMLAITSLFHGGVGVSVGFLLLLLTGGALLGVNLAWLTVAIVGVVVLIAAPVVIKAAPPAAQFLTRHFPDAASVTPWTMWALVWTATAGWVAWGFGLLLLARGLFPEELVPLSVHLTAWIASFLGGLVAFVAPAGLGVREEVMRTTLVAGGMGAGAALVLMVVARVWATILDVVPATVVLGFRFIRRRSTHSSETVPSQRSA